MLLSTYRVATDFFFQNPSTFQYISQTNISPFQYILTVSKFGEPQFQTLNQTSGTVSTTPFLSHSQIMNSYSKERGQNKGFQFNMTERMLYQTVSTTPSLSHSQIMNFYSKERGQNKGFQFNMTERMLYQTVSTTPSLSHSQIHHWCIFFIPETLFKQNTTTIPPIESLQINFRVRISISGRLKPYILMDIVQVGNFHHSLKLSTMVGDIFKYHHSIGSNCS